MVCISANLAKRRDVKTNGRSESEGITCLENKNFTILATFKPLQTSFVLFLAYGYSRAIIEKIVRIFGQIERRSQPRDGIWDRWRPRPMPTACVEPKRAPDQGYKRGCTQCELEVSVVLEHGSGRNQAEGLMWTSTLIVCPD